MKPNEIHHKIYLRYHKELFNYIYRIIREPELAQDILQDVFIKILSSKNPTALLDLPKKWFYTVARNECYRAWNENKKKETIALPDNNADLLPDPREKKPNDLLETVYDILQNFGNEYREIFWLKHESGLKNQEIAKILSISTKTVKRKLDQILWELQKKIKLSDFGPKKD
jgi:RNA polymerase sigma-70 factor (ECF subfamily)